MLLPRGKKDWTRARGCRRQMRRRSSNLAPQFRGIPMWVRIRVLDPTTQALIDEDYIEFQVR